MFVAQGLHRGAGVFVPDEQVADERNEVPPTHLWRSPVIDMVNVQASFLATAFALAPVALEYLSARPGPTGRFQVNVSVPEAADIHCVTK
jgi:hypothetical protein